MKQKSTQTLDLQVLRFRSTAKNQGSQLSMCVDEWAKMLQVLTLLRDDRRVKKKLQSVSYRTEIQEVAQFFVCSESGNPLLRIHPGELETWREHRQTRSRQVQSPLGHFVTLFTLFIFHGHLSSGGSRPQMMFSYFVIVYMLLFITVQSSQRHLANVNNIALSFHPNFMFSIWFFFYCLKILL